MGSGDLTKNDKATILFAVDDTSESLARLTKILPPAGYRVRVADSAELALAAVVADPPDLILLDVCLKGVDGLEVCRRLKAREETRHIPIILVSALADVKEWVEGLQLGAVDYITKPFQTEELLVRVETHLSLSRAHISLVQQAAALCQANEQLQSEAVKRQRMEDELRQSLDRAERSRGALLSILEDQQRAETALHESEAQFRAIFEVASIGIVQLDPRNGQMIRFNQKFCDITGYTDAELRTLEFPELTHPDDRQCDWEIFSSAAHGDTPDYRNEKRYIHKDGSIVWVRMNAAFIRDGAGQALRSVVICEDITERKQAEEENEELQVQLIQAQKMEAVGRLAGGVAHDFNNILSVILGYTELALEKVTPADPLHADLEEILSAGRRSRGIIRQLLAFARKQKITPEVLDLNSTVEGMLKMLRQLIGEDIDLVWLPGGGSWLVKMDPSQIDQILANLCVNARDAIGNTGNVTIETSKAALDQAYCDFHLGFVPGEFVLLTVSDNGCGMDKETVKKAFEPFFTTKELGHGTGMGLATVYGIVKQNNGFINVYSEPNQGTTFKIYLPLYAGQTINNQTESDASIPKGHNETLLLVEDDVSIVRLASTILKGLGYTVLTAETPEEAIRLVEVFSGEIHLLITDVVLPTINGRQLAERLQSIRPAMKCLFMSGYTAGVIAHRGVLNVGVQFLSKPFSIKDIAIKVRGVLDQK